MVQPLPTPSELEILRLLWERGPLSVREVHDTIRRSRDVGYTTVLKTMQVMHEKGLLLRDETARSHVYTAAAKEGPVKRRVVSDLVDRLFAGSAAELVMQALSAKRASPEELKEIRAMLDDLKRDEK